MTEASLRRDASRSFLSSLKEFAREHPYATAAIGALALAGLVAVAKLLLASGDEPPIRVKKGSMEFHVLHQGKFWKGGGQAWSIGGGIFGTDGGTRSKETYDVVITPNGSNVAGCPPGTRPTGASVQFTYSDGKSVTLSATGKHTHVTADATLNRSANKKVLVYTPTGYIAAIAVDGTPVCTFANEDELVDVLLLDF
jgi:hypothetical protein